jgi:hypothetical protein
MPGRHQCAHEALRSTIPSDRSTISLTHLPQDSKDVEEKLGDLIPWVLKLKESVPAASADGDPEGAKRDEQLILFVSYLRTALPARLILCARELNEIGRQSEALAKKGVEARLADHKQDSGKVLKLVERLRQALLIYQVRNTPIDIGRAELTCLR